MVLMPEYALEVFDFRFRSSGYGYHDLTAAYSLNSKMVELNTMPPVLSDQKAHEILLLTS